MVIIGNENQTVAIDPMWLHQLDLVKDNDVAVIYVLLPSSRGLWFQILRTQVLLLSKNQVFI